MQNFHERLKEKLKQKKVSQRELARRMGIKPQSLWVWMNESYPSVERLIQICEILEVSADFLLGLNPNTGGSVIFNLSHGLRTYIRACVRALVSVVTITTSKRGDDF